MRARRYGSTRSRPPPTNNRGSAYRMKGDYAHAIADYNEALRLKPSSKAALLGRGIAYQRTGNSDRSIVDLTEAIRLDPVRLRLRPAGFRVPEQGRLRSAIADYGEAIRLEPATARYRTDRGIAYGFKLDSDQSVRRLQRGDPP